ncbi:baculoviral IAP repeat-containing protein 5a [Synchiropus splendidus]|uniref:baculoviral IAP repeat-containing protein 5a n=1 Tax=Synchiropus splendidus TaxID=270530 RepID=UPI00237DDF9E|nr:baculoviral IAP repeat-containing protein 5a [Synchiropus splendidus]
MEAQMAREFELFIYENRLKTFQDWPFNEDCVCTPEKMAKSGFIHKPLDNSPDVAMCFFCLKELEGWEPEDDPQKEHRSHSSGCGFLNLKKNVEDLTVEEILKLQKERLKNIVTKSCKEGINKFKDAAKVKRQKILKKCS